MMRLKTAIVVLMGVPVFWLSGVIRAGDAQQDEPAVELKRPEEVRREIIVRMHPIAEAAKQKVKELQKHLDELRLNDVEARLRLAPMREMALSLRMQKAAYLGVSTSPLPPSLRQQLKLPKGVGLLVDHVESGSAAEAAGLKQFDVLHKVDDQLLINTQQMAVLIRMHKPGEEVKLTVIREGKSQTLTAKLTEKELADVEDPMWSFSVPPEITRLTEPGGFGLSTSRGMVTTRREQDGRAKMMYKDDQHSLTITQRDNHKWLRAEDRDGRKIFDGPIDTDEQRRDLPPEIRAKLRIFEKIDVPQPPQPSKARSFRWMDGDLIIEATSEQPGKLQLRVVDPAGQELYRGPIDTAEQRKSLPDKVRKLVESDGWKAMLDQLREPAHPPVPPGPPAQP